MLSLCLLVCLCLLIDYLKKLSKNFYQFFWRGGMCSWSDFGDDPEYDADTEIFGKEFLYH